MRSRLSFAAGNLRVLYHVAAFISPPERRLEMSRYQTIYCAFRPHCGVIAASVQRPNKAGQAVQGCSNKACEKTELK
jgi:hypothetical protein